MRTLDPSRTRLLALLLATVLLVCACFSASEASADAQSARLPCAEYDTSIGEYGAYVFRLRYKPKACVEFKGNQTAHAFENRLKQIKWHRWGAARTTATATWYYCGMGRCFFRRAFLVASRIKETCGLPVYTFLKMRLPAARSHGQRLPASQGHFNLPACSTVYGEYLKWLR
jgi:hypothetical protein